MPETPQYNEPNEHNADAQRHKRFQKYYPPDLPSSDEYLGITSSKGGNLPIPEHLKKYAQKERNPNYDDLLPFDAIEKKDVANNMHERKMGDQLTQRETEKKLGS